jgi:hypothetical protein
VTIRNIRPLAVALGLGAAGVAGAADIAKPMTVPVSANQQLADVVATRLSGTPATQGADVSIDCKDGVVTLKGSCKDKAQLAAIQEMVRVTPGVKLVQTGLKVAPNGVTQAQAMEAPAQMSMGPVAMPVSSAVPPSAGGPVIEPVPLGQAGGVMSPNEAPPLPPYAWPTYAPYNNVSRVAYPQAYPYNAFPFIGPYYPFPKVPLGWRSVRLDWEDGHWWIGKTSTPQDYWRVRFW